MSLKNKHLLLLLMNETLNVHIITMLKKTFNFKHHTCDGIKIQFSLYIHFHYHIFASSFNQHHNPTPLC